MPDDDYYDRDAASPPAREHEEGRMGEHEEKSEGKTALINSDICPDMKPGDEMVVKIERVMDGQYEVSYAPEPEHEDMEHGERGMEEKPAMNRDSEMASMYD
jgi:hypothetical protein